MKIIKLENDKIKNKIHNEKQINVFKDKNMKNK